MRIFLMVVLLVTSCVTAFAQAGGKARPGSADGDKAAKEAADIQRERASNAAAAKDALSRIPDSKEKYDPWKIGK